MTLLSDPVSSRLLATSAGSEKRQEQIVENGPRFEEVAPSF